MIDCETFAKIHDCHDRQGLTIAQTARALGLDPKTVATWVARPSFEPRRSRARGSVLDPFKPHITRLLDTHLYSAQRIFQRLREEGYRGGVTILRDYVRRIDAGRVPKPDRREQARQAAFEWMRAVLQMEVSPDALRREIGDVPDFAALLRRLHDGRLSDRNRSMAVLAKHRGLSIGTMCGFLGIDKRSCRKYVRAFEEGGQAALFVRQTKSTRKFDDDAIKQAVFGTLHEPPSNYGINRTTWIMPDLSRVLREAGRPVCSGVIRKITKAAGYRWRKARIVLTSHDPDYTEKLGRIRSILSSLEADEAFFSVDEFGPFSVKMKPGRSLTAPGEQRVVPQWQKSRGSMIVTAALELSTNQVTHFYSAKKNTGEMIRMMELLVEKYVDRRKLYLSWDAASWHISKRLFKRVEEHNESVLGRGGPIVETVPLPSGAQFLNVIESVFSGMARAIIHNSDYRTLDEAKAAIDRHFADRNSHFLEHPRRAGKKIWGKEREPANFSEANNCKDPRYR
jgi:hypothetical protein